MGFSFSNWYDKMSGKSMQTDEKKFMSQYDDAYADVNANYANMQGIAEGMMDPYSANNLRQRNIIQDQGADAAAEASRLGGRNAAMAGGAPAASLAMQTMDQGNKVQAGGIESFNKFLGGQFNQGLSALSGVTSNMATMAGNRFNTNQNLIQTNKQIDADATKFGTNLVGSAFQGAAGLVNPASALGGMGGMFGLGVQRGGLIQKYAGGGPVSQSFFQPSGGAGAQTIREKFARQSMDEIGEGGFGRNMPQRPDYIDQQPNPGPPMRQQPDYMQIRNDELKNPWNRPEGGGMIQKAFEEANPELMRQKEAAREQNMKAQQGMGGMLGGMMGQRGGYVGMQGGGDPADYRAKLEGMDQTYQDKMDANLYTSEGDYTQEGLKDRWGFTNEAVIDTAWGGNTPNSAMKYSISEEGRPTHTGQMGAGNRMEFDQQRDEMMTGIEWGKADKAAGRDNRHPDSYGTYSMNKMMGPPMEQTPFKSSFDDIDWDNFQEGGAVNSNSGILSQVMGPKGPMRLQTRIGGIKLG